MRSMESPLRYPGSKKSLARYIESLLKENLFLGMHFIEPFAGGASVSLHLLHSGLVKRVTLIEKDPLLFSFWKVVTSQSTELCEAISLIDVSLQTWKEFRKYLVPDAHKCFSALELAMACLFFNRTNYSGILSAGPIGGMQQSSDYPIDCRFNKAKIISNITAIAEHRKRITVRHADSLQYLERCVRLGPPHDSFYYVDPPYVKNGKKLYRYAFCAKDHSRLASVIDRLQAPWVVSYDNHTMVRELFAGQKILPISLNYAVRKAARVEELIISNLRLLPVNQPNLAIDHEESWANEATMRH